MNPLSWIFGKKTPPTPLLEDFSKSASFDPARLFDEAYYGTKFRTVSFLHPEIAGLSIRREALHTPWNNRWMVTEVREQAPRADQDGASEQTRILSEGLPFFAAVRDIASFECNQQGLGGYVSDSRVTRETLGTEHYQAFAEREGIIFDVEGVPHPTLRGEIVTGATFTSEAKKRARAFKRGDAPSRHFETILAAILEVPAPYHEDGRMQTESLFKKLKYTALTKDFLSHLKKMHVISELCFDRKIWKDAQKCIMSTLPEDFYYQRIFDSRRLDDEDAAWALLKILSTIHTADNAVKQTPAVYIEQETDACLKIINDMKDEDKKETKEALTKIVMIFNFIFHLLGARQALRAMTNDDTGNAAATMAGLESYLARAERSCRNAGVPEDTLWQIRATACNEDLKVPAVLNELIAGLEKTIESENRETARMKTALTGPA